MARELDLQLPEFKSGSHILGCVAHVINLAAKIGIASLGEMDEENEGEEISMASVDDVESTRPSGTNRMNINLLVSAPDGAGINAQSILKRVHGLCSWVRLTPQCRQKFAIDVNSCQPELYAKKIRGLDIDVPTRWNTTYIMFQRAISLNKSCTHFCKQNAEASRFLLSPSKWTQARNIMKLLQPLSDATEMLCASKYPTLNKVLPIYMVLVKHLHLAREGLYDQDQLILPANQMISKFNQYLNNALKKPVYLCAMVLDPKFKLTFWNNHEDFIVENYNISVAEIEKIFLQEALKFEAKFTPKPQESAQPLATSPPLNNSIFATALYQPSPEIKGIQAEIALYLKEDIATQDIEVLPFWASRRKTYPKLALMARRYLSIPATSAASERVFSTGRRIVSWQRSSLKPSSIESLLCLKNWFQAFDGPF
ncbi:hypothetical protein PGT21_050096 [Puccinia graminis f. sp. tritici]|uniref:HAT C-terminal dimerisation domain-containing protein n=1 Tax=Puccinia graminis f. sp. tritici TaxID=56615 RepID=A0A5B0MAE3_PUCGR|nr:hypothetical protein PGT21_050096 [Puccinia graminis f. sp. tritici]